MLVKVRGEKGAGWIDASRVMALSPATGKDGAVLLGITVVVADGVQVTLQESMDDLAKRINDARAEAATWTYQPGTCDECQDAAALRAAPRGSL